MKIDTERAWTLKTVKDDDMLEIQELHLGSEKEEQKPYIIVPVEAVDDLIYELIKFKRKCKTEGFEG